MLKYGNLTIPRHDMEYSLDVFVAYAYYGHKRERSAQIVVFRDQIRRLSSGFGGDNVHSIVNSTIALHPRCDCAGAILLMPVGQPLTTVSAAQAQPLGATFTVTNTNDSGTGSLRQAILYANATTDQHHGDGKMEIMIGNATHRCAFVVLGDSGLSGIASITDRAKR
jgi:hypothetical protein